MVAVEVNRRVDPPEDRRANTRGKEGDGAVDMFRMTGNKSGRASLTAVLSLLAALSVGGCHGGVKQQAPASTGESSAKEYAVRGKVLSVNAKNGTILLDAQAIPGYMEAMTMNYTLENPSETSGLHAGDTIMAQLEVGPQGAVLDDIDVIRQATLNAIPEVQYHVPRVGDEVPNFGLLNQNGRKIHLDQFHGKVLVLTFIYTRCQSSQFCPLMSRNFADLNRLLAAEPKLYAASHLLSISFDPKYDTPAVLRSYGGAYTGLYTKEKFQHWDFAAPSAAELASLLQWFDVGVTQSRDEKVLLHSVSTAVVGPEGKIRAWYPTNTWTPQQVLKDVESAASSDQKGGQ